MRPYFQHDGLTIYNADNLEVMRYLAEVGMLFDLVELDGPYMAGLEEWDNLTEEEYIQHYAERLPIVRDLMQPWAVTFVFGYPEGCAEIKSWAHRTKTLYLRRWLTWYKQITSHKGRKIESILFLTKEEARLDLLVEFGNYLRQERNKHGWSLHEIGQRAGKPWWHRGGNFYYETGHNVPSRHDFQVLKHVFGFNGKWDHIINLGNYEGLTDIDYINKTFPESTRGLNNDGLRSKPIELYMDLFKPTTPLIDDRALILYGGSGNAGIAAAALGYDVTICETDRDRCDLIAERWESEVERWRQKMAQLELPGLDGRQMELFND